MEVENKNDADDEIVQSVGAAGVVPKFLPMIFMLKIIHQIKKIIVLLQNFSNLLTLKINFNLK